MTETEPTAPAAADTGEQPQIKMQILAQYIRDMSFENILVQKGMKGDVKPDMQVQVKMDAKKRSADHQYEVQLKINITAKNTTDGATLFLLELDYAGVFHVENVPESQLHPYLLIECPRLLFPFVRRIVSDVTRDGGLPPLNMDNIDFVALYRQEAERRAQAEKVGQPVS